MKSIDLVLFADHSAKIPVAYLTPENKPRLSSFRVLAAHLIDASAALVLSVMMAAFFAQSMQLILVTQDLRTAFDSQQVMALSQSLLPLTMFTYFFFCYFLNHGQSYGMYLMKKRIEMNYLNFQDALKWAASSLLMCVSFGITYALRRSSWEKFKSQDYLYQELMEYKDLAAIDLLARVDEFEAVKKTESYWVKAA